MPLRPVIGYAFGRSAATEFNEHFGGAAQTDGRQGYGQIALKALRGLGPALAPHFYAAALHCSAGAAKTKRCGLQDDVLG